MASKKEQSPAQQKDKLPANQKQDPFKHNEKMASLTTTNMQLANSDLLRKIDKVMHFKRQA